MYIIGGLKEIDTVGDFMEMLSVPSEYSKDVTIGSFSDQHPVKAIKQEKNTVLLVAVESEESRGIKTIGDLRVELYFLPSEHKLRIFDGKKEHIISGVFSERIAVGLVTDDVWNERKK